MLIRTPGSKGWHEPESTAYSNEAELERLLAESPGLLPFADPSDPTLILSQVPVGLGILDLLGVTVSGSIIVVECKLRQNPEIRRRVIAQILDYAASLWELDFAALEAAIRSSGSLANPLAVEVGTLAESAGISWDETVFRAAIEDNLRRGRFKLVVAVDETTDDLKRVVAYLNAHSNADLQLATLELRYSRDGEIEVLVPQVYGAELVAEKSRREPKSTWDEVRWLAAVAELQEPASDRVATELLAWTKGRGLGPRYGAGRARGDMYPFLIAADGKSRPLFGALTWGKVEILFNELKRLPPFDDLAARLEIARRLNVLPDVNVTEANAQGGWPMVPFAAIAGPESWAVFKATFDWVVDESVRAGAHLVAEAGAEVEDQKKPGNAGRAT